MRDKCTKYESYYVFCDEESFNEHLKSCTDCQNEHLKMQKVSTLVQGVKASYFADKQTKLKKLVSCVAFLIFSLTTVAGYGIYSYNHNAIMSDGSLLYDLGCPVDEYGLLKM